jgi:hypothetical protein
MVQIVLSCRSMVEIDPWGLEKISGLMNHISPDLRSMTHNLNAIITIKQSNFYDFFGYLKVINLWGDFEALNDIFKQSKPTKTKCTKISYFSID